MPVRNVATPDIGRPSTVISRTCPSGVRRRRSAPATRPSILPSQKNAGVAVLELVSDSQLLERLDRAAVGVRHYLAPLEGSVGHGGVQDDVRGERVDQSVDIAGGHCRGEGVAHGKESARRR